MEQPKNLDEIVDLLITQIKAQEGAEDYVKKNGIDHHGAGTAIRNGFNLWWSEKLRDDVLERDPDSDYPKERPELVAWFNSLNIYHADDMSGTISEAVKAKLNDEPFDIDKHIKRYFSHWKKHGFKDGIFKEENKIK
jgi:hypothetical protein